LKKSTSYKVTLKKNTIDVKSYSRSPKGYGLFSNSNNNFNLNTQRVLAGKARPSSRYQNTLTTQSSAIAPRNVEFNLRQSSKSGRNSESKEYKSMGRDRTGYSELKSYKAQDKLNTNYFTNGTLTSATNLNSNKNN
jgi:hypothetical protein